VKKSKRREPAAPNAKPVSKVMMWAVVVTAAAALILLMILARDILAQMRLLGGSGGAASTRLLTGLFVVMCFAGFVAAGLWAALKKALGKSK
jgi:small neutral amino acid transporter SnatA (MarC family)